jgi:hypothetical protein
MAMEIESPSINLDIISDAELLKLLRYQQGEIDDVDFCDQPDCFNLAWRNLPCCECVRAQIEYRGIELEAAR